MGDVHGHLMPRPHLRGDGNGRLQGGLARLYALVEKLRAGAGDTLLFNTGDTIQGSAEALFTRGQALVEVLDRFRIDGFVPGNWDYLYGKARFLELFGPGSDGAGGDRWGAVAANVYDSASGALLLPPYRMVDVDSHRVAVIGLSSERAINALGPWATEGIRFTNDAVELAPLLEDLRVRESPHAIVLLSEFGLAKNVLIAKRHPSLAVVLSSDMHEETRAPVVTAEGVLVSEVGQDGTRLGQLDLVIEGGRVRDWVYRLHVIDDSLDEDAGVAECISRVRRPFVTGSDFRPHVNPINGAVLETPIDTVVGHAGVALHRSGFVHDAAPAALQGTSSQYLAEAFRRQARADVGHMRGFRYGTHVAPGPIRLEDLYHYLPVGAQVATGTVTGEAFAAALERSADGVFNPDPFAWTGGWLDAYAGLRFEIDPAAGENVRISNVQIQRFGETHWTTVAPSERYHVAGFWYARRPDKVGSLDVDSPDVLRSEAGAARDACEVVVDDLAQAHAHPDLSGLTLLTPLPEAAYGNPELQPLRGVARVDGPSPKAPVVSTTRGRREC